MKSLGHPTSCRFVYLIPLVGSSADGRRRETSRPAPDEQARHTPSRKPLTLPVSTTSAAHHPLGETGARLGATYNRFGFEVSVPPGNAWIRLTDSCSSSLIATWLDQLTQATDGHRDVAGSYLGMWFAGAVARPLTAASLWERRVPVGQLGKAAIRRLHDGTIDRLALADASMAVLANDPDGNHPDAERGNSRRTAVHRRRNVCPQLISSCGRYRKWVPRRSWQAVRSSVRPWLSLLAVLALTAASCSSSDAPTEEDVGSAIQTESVMHDYGETEVPTDPQRVAVLHTSTILGTALLLDVPIVAYQRQEFGDGVLPFFDASKLEGAVDAGRPELNLEAIASAQPDLIVSQTGVVDDGAIYERLSQIAPTVVFEAFGSTPWRDTLRQLTQVFGGEEQIEQGISDYERRVEEIRAEAGARIEDTSVTLVNFRGTTDIRIYGNAWCSGSVLEDVGLVRPPEQRGEEGETVRDLSIEQLPRLDGDLLLYFVGSTATSPDEAGQATAAITSSPLWETLGAVQSGQTYQVDTAHWFTCGSLQAQNEVLDDVEGILLGDPQ